MDLTKFTSQIFKCELPPFITKYFKPHHVNNDGDCLFSCIGLAVEKTADTVRREICRYMYNNSDTFFINEYIFQGVEHIDVDRYIHVMQMK
jgi:hypothetical protein